MISSLMGFRPNYVLIKDFHQICQINNEKDKGLMLEYYYQNEMTINSIRVFLPFYDVGAPQLDDK